MKSKNVLLIFKKEIMYKPIIYRLARDYETKFNVLEAKILPKLEGRIILGLQGTAAAIKKSLDYLNNEGVIIEVLADKITKNEDKCIHCGACTAVCRVDALAIDRETMEVKFYPEKCVACGLCKIACPVKAMSGTSIDLKD
ncbi:MAG TPA: 4Fe-4S binding protein [Spirochaetota bacterium]|nr:4Fe-4S binding protein [Spirochaetota bacterium]HPI88237.1 4Fe-4S binding protein [Spirochaetota bacterium]HPR47219.1 4Fe-4S binding protein [Spirochaetota bacterium]